MTDARCTPSIPPFPTEENVIMTVTTPQNGAPVAERADPPFAKPPTDKPKPVAQSDSVRQVDPNLCDPAAGNRTPTPELVARLMQSIAAIGQQVPGMIRPHPALPGRYEVIMGSLRSYCCARLGLKFRAIEVATDVPPERMIQLRFAENDVREAMSILDVADDMAAFMRLTGCTQAQLAERLHVSPSKVSGALRTAKDLAPELREMVANFAVVPGVATLIAKLPTHELQREAMARATQTVPPMTRDAVAEMVARMKGPKGPRMPPEEKVKKFRLGSSGLTAVFAGKKIGISDLVTVLASWHAAAKAAAASGQSITTLALIVADADKAKEEKPKDSDRKGASCVP
jgi:ParB/RepB/Spo0J family partition protein